jgi:hypothetical protein
MQCRRERTLLQAHLIGLERSHLLTLCRSHVAGCGNGVAPRLSPTLSQPSRCLPATLRDTKIGSETSCLNVRLEEREALRKAELRSAIICFRMRKGLGWRIR